MRRGASLSLVTSTVCSGRQLIAIAAPLAEGLFHGPLSVPALHRRSQLSLRGDGRRRLRHPAPETSDTRGRSLFSLRRAPSGYGIGIETARRATRKAEGR